MPRKSTNRASEAREREERVEDAEARSLDIAIRNDGALRAAITDARRVGIMGLLEDEDRMGDLVGGVIAKVAQMRDTGEISLASERDLIIRTIDDLLPFDKWMRGSLLGRILEGLDGPIIARALDAIVAAQGDRLGKKFGIRIKF